jgi:ATP-dependent DNA ligase
MKPSSCTAFDLMFANGEDLRELPLLERKKRLMAVLPHHKLIAFSAHRKGNGKKFFAEAERSLLEGIMARCTFGGDPLRRSSASQPIRLVRTTVP